MLPEATLAIECQMMNPPKPHGVAVMVDGKPAAVVTLTELARAYEEYRKLQAAYDSSRTSTHRSP